MKVNCKFYQGETFGCFFCEKHGRILPDFCGHCADKKAKSKYNNKKTVVNGITFDSSKECKRFLELSLLQNNGVIKNLERQKRFQLVPKTKDEKAIFYLADFVYEEKGRQICEDVKSAITRKNSTYIIKRKLFKYLYPGYVFRET